MTVPATHLGEPLRPLLRRTFARALLGGVWAYVVLVALMLVASLSPGASAVAERLFLDSGTFGAVGAVAQAVLVATLFTPPIVVVLERGDRRRVSAELTFAAVLAGTLTTAFVDRPLDDGGSLYGIAVAVLAIHWLVYGVGGPRRVLLPRRTVLIAGAVLLVAATGVAVRRAAAEPLLLDDDSLSWSTLRARDIAPGSVVAGRTSILRLDLEHHGSEGATIADVRSVTRGVAVRPVTEPDAWSEPPGRPLRAFEPVSLAPGGDVWMSLVARGRCELVTAATLELVYAGGGTQRVSLSGGDPGTCAAP